MGQIKPPLHILELANAANWERWLDQNHADSSGIWVRLFKKGSGKQTFTYDEALDGALCYGWIDGHKKSYDHESWIQKFTPRRPKSIWSKRNRQHIERLLRLHKMRPEGIQEVERAKEDGRWDRAYDSPAKMEIPNDFLQELSKNETALEFFKSLNSANRYAIAFRLQTAKDPSTRKRRLLKILAQLNERRKFHE
jgi:uncharacterized protein YdeI (YjbR/CyaY-like superfamily)